MSLETRLKELLLQMMSDGFDSQLRPADVSSELKTFSSQIGASSDVHSVPIQQFDHMRPGQCFNNCICAAALLGGKVLYGWSYHQFHDLFLVAEFHAVWQAPDRQLIDVTPPLASRVTTTFAHDPVRVVADAVAGSPFKGTPSNQRFALRKTAEVLEWIQAEDANAAMNRRRLEHGEVIPLTEVVPVIERNVNARRVLLSKISV